MHNSIYTERVQGKVNKIIKDSCIGKDWLARGNANCIGDDPKATRFAKLINFFPPAYCLGYSGLTRRSHKSFFALIHTSTNWPWYFTCRHDSGKIRLIAPILDLHSAPSLCAVRSFDSIVAIAGALLLHLQLYIGIRVNIQTVVDNNGIAHHPSNIPIYKMWTMYSIRE